MTARDVHFIETRKRVVPLKHQLYVGGERVTIKSGEGGYEVKGWEKAKALVGKKAGKRAASAPRGGRPAWQDGGGKSQWQSLVRHMEKEELLPGIVFSFSKRKCQEIADWVASLNLNSKGEQSAVVRFGSELKSRLSDKDASLPQVLHTIELAKVGVGVHHGGMLPVLKEFVEILFSRGLVKILCATETFAMGVNMPSKSVMFSEIRKNDGTQFRCLLPGEYTQMAGRAGRRGLDDVGVVVVPCFAGEIVPSEVLKQMLTGKASRLQSQFRLTYAMILNLIRLEDMNVEDMMRRR